MIHKLLILFLAILLSGCATIASQAPKVSQIAYKPMLEVPEPELEQGLIVLAVYQFVDLTGQQKPNTNFGEMSKAVTQGSANLLIKALKDVGDGKWFRVVERESLQSLLQERKLIRTTRQMTQGENAQPLGPMLYAGAYITGGIVGYDSNTLSGGVGHRFLGIGARIEYRHDTVTVMLRLVNVVTGEVELAIMTEKTIMSVSTGADAFKYLDLDTKLIETEIGVALNEPVTYAIRKTIESAVVEMIKAGEAKGLWHYKPVLEPEVRARIQGIFDIIEENTLEPWIDPGKAEEVYDDYKKKPKVVKVIEEVIEEEEKIEVMDIGDPPGQSNDNDLVEPAEEPDEENTRSPAVITPDIAKLLRS